MKVDDSDNTVGKKIRTHRKMRPAYMVIIGDEETENGTVSISDQEGANNLMEFQWRNLWLEFMLRLRHGIGIFLLSPRSDLLEFKISSRSPMTVLFLVVLVDMLGFTIVIPFLTYFVQGSSIWPRNQ